MNILVLYDSFFGNTEIVAKAIADGMRGEHVVTVRKVASNVPLELAGVDAFVFGSPTRGFRPTPAMQALLNSIPKRGLHSVGVAAFDTRIAVEDVKSPVLKGMVRVFGYAAAPMSKRLSKKGGRVLLPPEGFFVEDSKGPLREGEEERARLWGERLAGELK